MLASVLRDARFPSILESRGVVIEFCKNPRLHWVPFLSIAYTQALIVVVNATSKMRKVGESEG